MTFRAFVSSLALLALACGDSRSERSARSDPRVEPSGLLLTVHATPAVADSLLPALLETASRHGWTLSVRTDTEAAGDADLVVSDSGGRFVARVREGGPNARAARLMAEAVLPR